MVNTAVKTFSERNTEGIRSGSKTATIELAAALPATADLFFRFVLLLQVNGDVLSEYQFQDIRPASD